MGKKDYYQILGVEKTATAEQIKKAYRRLARKHHPDVNPGDKSAEERFKEIQEAYDTLRDTEKRAQYDRFGHAGPGYDFSQHAGRGRGGGDPFRDYYQSHGQGINIDDLFGNMFGGGSTGSRRVRMGGRDIESEMTVTLEQALSGVETQVTIPTTRECPACGGHGRTIGKNTRACPTCKGSGRAKIGKGPFNFSGVCQTCEGIGKVGLETCHACGGAGNISENRRLTVKIPPGVDEGSRIRVGGQGESGGSTGTSGDLYISIHLAPHNIFKRQGDNLQSEEPLPFHIAILGGKISVRTIDGATSTMTIPPGTQGAQKFRLKGKGMPKIKGTGRGDLYVTVNITIPASIDPESRKLIEEFAMKSGA